MWLVLVHQKKMKDLELLLVSNEIITLCMSIEFGQNSNPTQLAHILDRPTVEWKLSMNMHSEMILLSL